MKRVLFLIFTGTLTVLFLVAMGKDMNTEWSRTQRTFIKTLEKHERRGLTGGIKQILLEDLGCVDRCTTCHVAIDKPQLALAEEPFTAHPGVYLQWHPVEKFGCTVCHGGQGLATEAKAAHGDVRHWEQPLLRGGFVQASCAQCHGNIDDIREHVPLLTEGKALFQSKGCYGCHAINDFGQTVSQDLTEVGSKSYLLLEADFEMMPLPHDRIHWLKAKLNHPRMLNPGVTAEKLPKGEEEVFPSAMPHFGLREHEIDALTAYLISLSEFDPPVSYTIPGTPEPKPAYASQVERGQAVFERFGCAGCHGAGGVGGRRNWNAGLGEEVPPLLYVKAYYGNDAESLKQLIRNGRQPAPRGLVHRPNPSLYMPPWKDRLAEDDIDAVVAYLFSLSDRIPGVPAPSPEPDVVFAEPAAPLAEPPAAEPAQTDSSPPIPSN
jgi:mono/diheme cytochrome c family protein